MSKVLCIIQARMGSTRLPGKVMKIINGETVLQHVFNRVSRAKKIDQIVVATTTLTGDDVIDKYCKNNNIECYRGDEKDLLARYYETAKEYRGEIIVRITSDCPLIEPRIIDLMLENYNKEWAYYSNCHPVRVVPVGLDVEITSFNYLQQAYQECKDMFQREHVFPYFYRNPDIFKIMNLDNQGLDTSLRITLDTSEDLHFIESIYKELKNKDFISIEDVDKFIAEGNKSKKDNNYLTQLGLGSKKSK